MPERELNGASMNNYTLIVTEKPHSAKRIAEALDSQGKPKQFKENGVPYFVASRDRELVVVPSIGHLYTIVHETGTKSNYPVFNFKWTPRHLAEKDAKRIRYWIETFSKLSYDADTFVSACDYDIEGSLIGYFILKYACGGKETSAKRMKFSTLTKAELEQAYMQPLPSLDFPLIEAGRTRHEVDWLYGINLSRALTLAARRWSGRYYTLSTGRVQGPTLQFLAEREKEIHGFVPTPYWQIKAEAEILNSVVETEYEKKRIDTRAEADAVVEACAGEAGRVITVEVRRVNQKPPFPFDVGTLQREAYSLFGYSPRRTLAIAQRLYLDALISYPRTSSQKLPPLIGYKTILNAFKQKREYAKLAEKLLEKEQLKPREGKKEDSAHPAIYPTGKLPEKPLGPSEKRIWDLVVRRFLTVFGDDALKEILKASLNVNGYSFFLRGRRILKQGWMEYYLPYARSEEVLLPQIEESDLVRLRRVIREEKFTCPPPRYNPSSLLKRMDELGIGTKATRADIIHTLYNRGYVRDERIVVTKLGFDVIDVLDKYAPILTSAQLTRELEDKMEQIRNNKMKRKTVLNEVVEQLKPQLEHFKENEESIGEVLTRAIQRAQAQERIVGKCPNCDTGNLTIVYSRKTGKRFIGCSNYFKGVCSTSFPLPQRGTVKPTGNRCKACGWPQILVRFKGRIPWNLCFNPDCSKSGRRKS
ncbi:MAG: DNA topoisomerase I [Candidatus Bathyarchaeota archaeon]|nr:DNA topoisomerase I [Candidatus Bathyarchaeum sp.]